MTSLIRIDSIKSGLAAVMIMAAAMLFAGCSPAGDPSENSERSTDMDWKITTTAFQEGERIPDKFTCTGPDVSPELTWTTPPEGTRELLLIMDDPDAPMGTWNHWIIYNLPPELTSLPEGVPKDSALSSPEGAAQGVTSFGRTGYGGPCPPPGKPHRYFFKLYALSKPLGLKPGASLGEVNGAMKGLVISESVLMGIYSR